MNTMRNMVFVVMLICAPSFLYASDLGSIHLKLVEGDVQIKTEDTKDWVAAAINTPVYEGDSIWSPEGGRAEVELVDGTLFRLDNNSSLEVLAVEKDLFQFYVATGRLYVNVRGPKGAIVAVETPTASIRAYDKAKFRVDVTEQEDSQVSVIAGEIFVERPAGEMKVSAGERLVLRKGAQNPQLAALMPPDPWEQWNRQRDRDFYDPRPDPGLAYLPEELKPYSTDLQTNGRWVNTGEYGYVWTPTVIVSTGWSPYRVGRWVWMRGDYVWVSYEPWGWAPYHYGRWAHVTSVGWCWVPPARGSVYWGPGYVGWVHTPTRVSWVPLAPREIYYGYGHYGPHSVNITNVHIDKTVVTNVYKNVYVNNGVTTVHRDTFISGRGARVEAIGNDFLRERVLTGAPRIAPVKATVMPVIKEIPQGRVPPQKIKNMEVRDLRRDRPPVRNRTEVVRPGAVGMAVSEREAPGKSLPAMRDGLRGRYETPVLSTPAGSAPVTRPDSEIRRPMPERTVNIVSQPDIVSMRESKVPLRPDSPRVEYAKISQTSGESRRQARLRELGIAGGQTRTLTGDRMAERPGNEVLGGSKILIKEATPGILATAPPVQRIVNTPANRRKEPVPVRQVNVQPVPARQVDVQPVTPAKREGVLASYERRPPTKPDLSTNTGSAVRPVELPRNEAKPSGGNTTIRGKSETRRLEPSLRVPEGTGPVQQRMQPPQGRGASQSKM